MTHKKQTNGQISDILERISDAFVSLDTEWRYTYVNRKAGELFNRRPEDLVGKSIWTEFPEGVGQPFYKAYYRAVEEQTRVTIEEYYPPWDRWFENRIYPSQAGLLIFFTDITERKIAEEKIKIANDELTAINRIVLTCSSTLDPNVVLNIFMNEALRITGLEGGTVCLIGPDETLHLAAHKATSDATIADLTTNAVKVGECLCGECARDHKPLIIRDREAVLKFTSREAMRDEDIRFHAAFPLIVKEKCLGVLCVFTRTDWKPLDRSLKLLETVTAQIALAIENAQLHEDALHDAALLENKVRQRTLELETKIAEIGRMNRLFVGRELRMVDLKKRIRELETKSGVQHLESEEREG